VYSECIVYLPACKAGFCGRQQHLGKGRLQWQCGHLSADLSELPFGPKCTQCVELQFMSGEGGRGRGGEGVMRGKDFVLTRACGWVLIIPGAWPVAAHALGVAQ
jgi:hypothetical protein